MQTETLTIKATPLPSGIVKAKTGNTTDSTTYTDWYKSVYMPVGANDPKAAQPMAATTGKAVTTGGKS